MRFVSRLEHKVFLIADQCEKGNVDVQYCPTKEMWADPMTKPLQGADFTRLTDLMLGHKVK